MSTDATSRDEEEHVARFLLHNSKFLENYLVEHSSIPFLKDVSSRMESTFIQTESNHKNQCDNFSSEGRIDVRSHSDNSKTTQKIESGSPCLSSEISINICHDIKEVTEESFEDVKSEIITDNLLEYSKTIVEQDKDSKDENTCPSSPSVVPRTARKSVTSDLFHQWLQSGSAKIDPAKLLQSHSSLSVGGTPFPNSPSGSFTPSSLAGKDLELLEQNDRLMDLILDISNELDINILCHKILLNVGHLTKADRCSLFLARGPREKRYLEAKLFDVDINTSKWSRNIALVIYQKYLYIVKFYCSI